MEKRPFGRTDMQVSVLGFGSAEIGMDSVSISDKDVELLLNAALEQDINVTDTASSYKRSEGQIAGTTSTEHLLLNAKGKFPDDEIREIRQNWQEAREPAWAGVK